VGRRLYTSEDVKRYKGLPFGGKEGLEEYSQGNQIRIYMDDTASYIYMPLTGNSRN
jgi:hypothetical protein